MIKLPPERRHVFTDSQLQDFARIAAFLQTLLVSYSSIFAISKSVGTKKLYPIYQEILEKYSSLISVRLIDVAIKLDSQMHLPLGIIGDLHEDLKKNLIAETILRRLAYRRMSLYETDTKEKQSCCRMLDIKYDDSRLHSSSRRIGKT